ncbi:MAG TPA: DUF2905 domain-containing protein [Chryseosolibacter sp.]|nr:DUF2905 domain-containing protein [Chryseosolibacter sp.]
MSKILITIGIVLVIAGLLIQLGHRMPWIGRLPGDVTVEKGNFKLYAPITTSILVSIFLSIVIYLINRFRNP